MLKREQYPMPEFILSALIEHQLEDLYRARPAYQRNDYIGWITRAKQQKTQIKRLNQMLCELQSNNVYMGMSYSSKSKK